MRGDPNNEFRVRQGSRYGDFKDEFNQFGQKWGDSLAATSAQSSSPSRPRGYTFSPLEMSRSFKVDEEEYQMKGIDLNDGTCRVLDINLHDGDSIRQAVERYYALCKDHINLHVTTSCFTVWRKHKKTNGHAKVIPAIPADFKEEQDMRVFFFDDNLEWGGAENSSGICNLRDIRTGEFVNFCEGENGFSSSRAARHTVIYSSIKYKAVLVKANILDAMEDDEYFDNIIKKYSLPNERLIVFMDVNSTIVCNDTVQGKDLANTLLSTMFEFVELRPRDAFELNFESFPAVRIDKMKTLKSLVKEITSGDNDAYGSFWTEERCWRLFNVLAEKGEVRWSGDDQKFTIETCQQLFKEYLGSLGRNVDKDGIAASWFRVYQTLRDHHTVVLNSFGVDTRKVVLATVPNEKRVIQVTVNYQMWDERDVKKFAKQFV